MGKQRQDRQRLAPTPTTTRELYLYSGNQCAFPGCTNSLLGDDGTLNCNIAHIHGVKLSAARGDHDLSDEKLRHVSNLLLLCLKHHKTIDKKELEDRFTVEVVQKMKEDHEKRYKEAIAGLVRIVDTSEGSAVRYPTNLKAVYESDVNTETEQNIKTMKPWIDAISKQPLGLRDLIVLILAHGEAENRSSPVRVKVTQIEGVVQIDQREISNRAKHLEHEGLLSIEEEEGIYFFELVDPTSGEIGWDLFSELHGLAAGELKVIRRAIDDLDFTVFDL